jgi:hypothetical protein
MFNRIVVPALLSAAVTTFATLFHNKQFGVVPVGLIISTLCLFSFAVYVRKSRGKAACHIFAGIEILAVFFYTFYPGPGGDMLVIANFNGWAWLLLGTLAGLAACCLRDSLFSKL